MDETLVEWTDMTKGGAAIEELYTDILERDKAIHAEVAEDFGILFVTPTVALFRGTV
jgi:hypothetical protein